MTRLNWVSAGICVLPAACFCLVLGWLLPSEAPAVVKAAGTTGLAVLTLITADAVKRCVEYQEKKYAEQVREIGLRKQLCDQRMTLTRLVAAMESIDDTKVKELVESYQRVHRLKELC